MDEFDRIVSDIEVSETAVLLDMMRDAFRDQLRRLWADLRPAFEQIAEVLNQAAEDLLRWVGPICASCGWHRLLGDHDHVGRMARGQLSLRLSGDRQETP